MSDVEGEETFEETEDTEAHETAEGEGEGEEEQLGEEEGGEEEQEEEEVGGWGIFFCAFLCAVRFFVCL